MSSNIEKIKYHLPRRGQPVRAKPRLALSLLQHDDRPARQALGELLGLLREGEAAKPLDSEEEAAFSAFVSRAGEEAGLRSLLGSLGVLYFRCR